MHILNIMQPFLSMSAKIELTNLFFFLLLFLFHLGHSIPKLLDAILTLLPLDTYVDSPVSELFLYLVSMTNPLMWKI